MDMQKIQVIKKNKKRVKVTLNPTAINTLVKGFPGIRDWLHSTHASHVYILAHIATLRFILEICFFHFRYYENVSTNEYCAKSSFPLARWYSIASYVVYSPSWVLTVAK